jgi:hypothetical protein
MAEKPFNRLEPGLERARIQIIEWQQVLRHTRPDSEQAAKARMHLGIINTHLEAETKLLAFLRRRWALYELFPTVDKPKDLLQQFHMWTGPRPGRPPPGRPPPKQYPLPF